MSPTVAHVGLAFPVSSCDSVRTVTPAASARSSCVSSRLSLNCRIALPSPG